MTKINKLIIIVFCLLLVIFLYSLWVGICLPKDISGTQSQSFLVEQGESLFQISRNLEKEGIIKNKLFFILYVAALSKQTRLQAGEYLLSPSMNIVEVADKIISGDIPREIITIPEGWNLRDIAWYFEQRGMFLAEELFELVGFPLVDYSESVDLSRPKDFSDQFDFLRDKPETLSLEGYLFPDTYFVNEQGTMNNEQYIEEIVKKMLTNFDRKLTNELREEIRTQGKTIFEITTMASLIEKEVRGLDDKEMVSGILWKRLENKVPLQVDATITYITGKKTTQVSKEETEIDSPYNTYKYRELPLGPICNPSIESIKTAIYPKESDYWYYLSTPEGETIFSRTLEEHNIAKAQYLK